MSDNIKSIDMEKINNEIKCEYCLTILKSKSNLKTHQNSAKYCLKIQNRQKDENIKEFICEICGTLFNLKDSYNKHYNKCSGHPSVKELIKIKKDLEECQIKCKILEIAQNDFKEREVKYEEHIKDLENKLENIALKSLGSYSDNFPDIIVTADEDEEKEEEKIEIIKENTFEDISTLKINNTYKIECRQEDGYINVTNLCKAGNKKFFHWNSLEKTKSFIRVLSSSIGIPMDELIAYKEGSIHERATWVHPQVAINIAQWISPQFDVQVSSWVYEIMITGKVDIKNTKSYKELHKENKCKDLRIKHLENKYVKKQKRIQYKEEFVMYILTTPFNKSSGIYTLGIASNFTNRLSTYNKSEEHEVIYYQSCGSEDTMKLVENMVFKKLENYRCQANKEKFQLKPDINITFFIDKIKECIGFFN